MAQTPEGRVKAMIKAVLVDNGVYFFMPVQGGYGAPGLDFHCVHQGRPFFIEAKAPGKKPTPRQLNTIRQAEAAGGKCFVIDGAESLEEMTGWLQSCTQPSLFD